MVVPSVQYVGKHDPSSTVDFRRKARDQGVINLCSTTATAVAAAPIQASLIDNRKRIANEEFSVPNGKRAKTKLYDKSESHYSITLQERWDEGTFRWVHMGKFTPNPLIPGDDGGPQNGELCVLKEFKSGSVYENHFFSKDILAVDKAAEIIREFNDNYTMRELQSRDPTLRQRIKCIKINKPKVWLEIYPDATGQYKRKLCEPMLEGKFLKFNSNNGFIGSSEFMQALSHFSYHATKGKYLLCDLQGGHYQDAYVLTDPVIMSQDNSKKYGSGDLGSEGIDNFFSHHTCGKMCRHWLKPNKPIKSERISVNSSTTLSLTLGTKQSEAERMRTLNAILSRART